MLRTRVKLGLSSGSYIQHCCMTLYTSLGHPAGGGMRVSVGVFVGVCVCVCACVCRDDCISLVCVYSGLDIFGP